jgi:hypothetical protein
MLRTVGPTGELGAPEHHLNVTEQALGASSGFWIGRSGDCHLLLDHGDYPLLISRKHAL